MSKKTKTKYRYYIGMLGAELPTGEAVASCPTDHKTVVQMRKDGLECHVVDCGTIEIAIMYKGLEIDPIIISMAMDAYIHFTEHAMPMYRVKCE